jgi:hypothetical protein
MSIRPYIVEHVKRGRLHRFAPPSRKRAGRRLFLTEKAMVDLTKPDGIVNLMALRGCVEAELKRWVFTGLVWVDLEGKPRFLKPLCPPPSEIWELRFTDPRVQIRLFGRFAEPDTIIGTKFHTRGMLGKKGSAQWRGAMNACEKSWDELFPGIAPFSAQTIHEYVTENCDEFPLCH